MKKIFLINLLIIGTLFSNKILAQKNNPCYFDEYIVNHKSVQQAELMIKKSVEKLKKAPNNKGNDSIKTIPVVVHVVHTGGTENISDVQIQGQIAIMNEDFGKVLGSNGVDTRVRFCLAKIDPNGNCTNGIVRIYSSLTVHQTSERAMLKQLSFWDNTMYMNIYIVKSINGALGYSSFPGSSPEQDGMVMIHSVFGNTGTASSTMGRIAAHEIGHWFGLYHTFQNGCGTDLCTDGDFVCDTPPQALPNYGCDTVNSCSNDIPDLNDQAENYMNYTPDSCRNMFTNGQKIRIQATLDTIRTNIWSPTNLIATGCDSAYVAPATCDIVANFVTLTPNICEGYDVDFADISLNTSTSWQWTFIGGAPASSTLQNPTVSYASSGLYDVKLVISDGVTTDSVTFNNYIDVTTPNTGIALPFNEDFDLGVFPPQGIIINNIDSGVTWGLDSAASVSGNYAVKINNYINTNYGDRDEIVLPYLDFTTFTGTNLFLKFKWAYARSDPSFSDEMAVLVSIDCGITFKQRYYRTGDLLATGPTQTTPFIPDSSQWNSASIFLNSYLSKSYVQIKIINVNDGGNNLYIDDINIGGLPTGIESFTKGKEFSIYPNPASNHIVLEFSDNTINKTVNMYSSMGKLVLSKKVNDSKKFEISVEQLSAGVYYLKLKGDDFSKTQKLIITK